MEIELRNLQKRYGDFHAVHDLSIGLSKGEMIALLGPSGCGKTTTLRIVAGFIPPSSGHIFFQGKDVTDTPPYKRDTGLVFQSYALFPHLTVTQNVEFGLKRRGIAPPERAARISKMLQMLRLEKLGDRYPKQLSGGQQQRVAVARALVINPAVLLLDEPFSNLDAKLRESTGIELRKIQRDLGLTSIFVTHDQQEAMAIADKIAVMNAGRVEQLGSAVEIYERPKTRFVADFIGSANFMHADITRESGGQYELALAGGLQTVVSLNGRERPVGSVVSLMVRPERVRLVSQQSAEAGLEFTIEAISYQGPYAHVIGRLITGEKMMVQVEGVEFAKLCGASKMKAVIAPVDLAIFSASN